MGSSRRAVPLVRPPHPARGTARWPWMTHFDHVSRPYAKFMADRNILSHYAMARRAQRLPGPATRATTGREHRVAVLVMAGMVAVETYFQNEASYKGGHYVNMMNPSFDRAGVESGSPPAEFEYDRLLPPLSARGGRRSGLAVSPESRFRSRKRGIAPTHMLGYEPR